MTLMLFQDGQVLCVIVFDMTLMLFQDGQVLCVAVFDAMLMLFQDGQAAYGTDGAVLCHQLLQRYPGVGTRLHSPRVLLAAPGGSLQQVSEF